VNAELVINTAREIITGNIVRREDSRHFRNKKKEYMKNKINQLSMNSKIPV
jgi:hypothetical protein